MNCDEEYNALVKATEKLHELYYQQETADTQFSNALRAAQNHLISSGLSRLVNATPAEIIYAFEESSENDFALLQEAAVAKSKLDSKVAAAEESYQYISQRYEDCLKENTKEKDSE
jgi:hypothetical protein